MGKKRGQNKSSNYMINMERHGTKEGGGYLGKLRSNFMGTDFVLYDKGGSPLEPSASADFPPFPLFFELSPNGCPRRSFTSRSGLNPTQVDANQRQNLKHNLRNGRTYMCAVDAFTSGRLI